MKNATAAAKNLKALLKKIGHAEPLEMPAGDPVETLVISFLMWESTTEKALGAWKRLREHIVDHNDLRVCMPHETVEVIGERYPRGLERAQRLRAVVRDIYLREHAVSLERLTGAGKRDARKYIESLEGMVPYVSSRLLLLCFDCHAMPVDDQLRALLVSEGVIEPDVELPDIASWLTRQIKASAGVQAHHDLQAWVDESGGRRGGARQRGAPRRPAVEKKSRRAPGRKNTAGST